MCLSSCEIHRKLISLSVREQTNVTVGQQLNIHCPHSLSSIKELGVIASLVSLYHMGTEERQL